MTKLSGSFILSSGEGAIGRKAADIVSRGLDFNWPAILGR